jgi:hypothetical protein
MNKNKKQIKQPLLPIEWIKEEDKDKQIYGSKRINLVRISQEKKIKKLQKVMLRWGDKFSHTTEWDKSNWRKDFSSVIGWLRHLSSNLNNKLSRKELKYANRLYRKYLGFVK